MIFLFLLFSVFHKLARACSWHVPALGLFRPNTLHSAQQWGYTLILEVYILILEVYCSHHTWILSFSHPRRGVLSPWAIMQRVCRIIEKPGARCVWSVETTPLPIGTLLLTGAPHPHARSLLFMFEPPLLGIRSFL